MRSVSEHAHGSEKPDIELASKMPLDKQKKDIYDEINMKKSKFGFTLIELLIVIALLGALAVGLMAALDPFEQLKKGDDTGVRNTVSELHGAVIRYYAIKSQMPWAAIGPTLDMTNASTGYDAANITGIVDAGELKADFSTLAGGQLARINIAGTDMTVTVCFKPASKSFRSDPNTKYNASGVEVPSADVQATCFSQTSAPTYDCYWCVR